MGFLSKSGMWVLAAAVFAVLSSSAAAAVVVTDVDRDAPTIRSWNISYTPPVYQLSGANSDYVSFPPTVSALNTTSFLIAFWLRTTETLRLFDLMGNRASPSHGSFVSIRMTGNHEWIPAGSVIAEVDQDEGGTNYVSVTSTVAGLNDGKWHHIAVTRVASALSIYVDGKLAGRQSGAGTANVSNSRELRIGRSLQMDGVSRFAPKATFYDVRILRNIVCEPRVTLVWLTVMPGVDVCSTSHFASQVPVDTVPAAPLLTSPIASVRPLVFELSGADDDYVSFPSSLSAVSTNNFLIAFWLRTTETSLPLFDLMGNRAVSGHGNFVSLRMAGNYDSAPAGQIWAEVDQDESGTNYIGLQSNVSGLNDGQWHYIALARNAAALSLYADGALVAQQTGAGVANMQSAHDFRIGRSLEVSDIGRFAPRATIADLRVLNIAGYGLAPRRDQSFGTVAYWISS